MVKSFAQTQDFSREWNRRPTKVLEPLYPTLKIIETVHIERYGTAMDAIPPISDAERDVRKSEALTELIALLVTAVPPGNDSPRQHRDKIRQRVIYGLGTENSDLLAALGAPDWSLDGELAATWARKKWPNSDLGPARFTVRTPSQTLGFSDQLFSWRIPGDLTECQDTLEKSYTVMRQMREQLRAQDRELARLRPLAARREEVGATNTRSAKRPRGG